MIRAKCSWAYQSSFVRSQVVCKLIVSIRFLTICSMVVVVIPRTPLFF
jgi:hypothetical protein